jgi:hypothetical protein
MPEIMPVHIQHMDRFKNSTIWGFDREQNDCMYRINKFKRKNHYVCQHGFVVHCFRSSEFGAFSLLRLGFSFCWPILFSMLDLENSRAGNTLAHTLTPNFCCS